MDENTTKRTAGRPVRRSRTYTVRPLGGCSVVSGVSIRAAVEAQLEGSGLAIVCDECLDTARPERDEAGWRVYCSCGFPASVTS